MATLEAFRTVLDDEGTPEIIRNHIIDSLQYALRNHGQIFTSKEVEWLASWDDARIPLAASRELIARFSIVISSCVGSASIGHGVIPGSKRNAMFSASVRRSRSCIEVIW